MPFSYYQVTKWLSQIRTLYVSLHFDDPGSAEPILTEVFGGSYARQKVAMTASSNGATFSAGNVTFKALPKTAITHVGFWDASKYGNLVGFAPLSSVIMVSPGKSISYPAGSLALSIGDGD